MNTRSLLAPFLIIPFLGCEDTPDFSDTPRISFDKVEFKTSASADSLNIFIDFEDGDGNLGLDDRFSTGEFSNRFYYTNENGEVITTDEIGNPGYSGLPPNSFPEGCGHWMESPSIDAFLTLGGFEIAPGQEQQFLLSSGLDFDYDAGTINDTIYYDLNPNHQNMTIDFLILDNDGQDYTDENGQAYRLFDWKTDLPDVSPPCNSDLILRFPVLNDNLNENAPIEGNLKYSINNFRGLIQNAFGSYEMRLRISIKDRAFNESNKVITPLFSLSEIRAN